MSTPAEIIKRVRLLREQGFRVLPVSAGVSKRPTMSGFALEEDPMFTAEQTDFGQQGLLIAILAGPCRAIDDPEWIACIDIDGDGNAERDDFLDLLPPTLESHEGRHLWYRVPAGFPNGKLFSIGKKDCIDVISHGKYAREVWDWAPSTDTTDLMGSIQPLPTDVLELITTLSTKKAPRAPREGSGADDECGDAALLARGFDPAEVRADAVKWLQTNKVITPEACGDGGNAMLLATAGVMVGFGLDGDTAYDLLETVYCPRVWPGEHPDIQQIEHKIETIEAQDSTTFEPFCIAHRYKMVRDGAAFLQGPAALSRLEELRAARKAELEGTADRPRTEDVCGLKLSPVSGLPYILQKGTRFWFHDANTPTYSYCYTNSELPAAVARELFNQIDEDDRTLPRMQARYIKPIQNLEASYVSRANTYTAATDTLSLATLKWMPPARAKFHANIDVWLRALFGDLYPNCAQWLASCVSLDRVAPALFVIADMKVGKSLLACGLARLYGVPEAVSMLEVQSDFNEGQGGCPLVFADEEWPQDQTLAWFREFVTSRVQRVNQKGVNKLSIIGCVRILVGTNNADVFRYQKAGAMTAADREAIESRLLVVDAREREEAIVAAVAGLDTDAVADYQLAEHVLHLATTVTLEPKGARMAAAPAGGDLLLGELLANRHPEVLKMIRAHLEAYREDMKDPAVAPHPTQPGLILVNTTRLYAALHEAFETKGVEESAVRDVCRSYTKDTKSQTVKRGGSSERWWRLNRASLEKSWDVS